MRKFAQKSNKNQIDKRSGKLENKNLNKKTGFLLIWRGQRNKINVQYYECCMKFQFREVE